MHSSPLINVILGVCSKTSRIFSRDFAELQMLQRSRNPLDRFVSNTIQRLERTVIDELKRVRPAFGIITDDITENTDADNVWIVSVLDGKDNFLHAMQLFTISIAVASRSHNGDIRPLSKLASDSEMQGALKRRNASVFNIHADPSIEATQQITAEVEFLKRSIVAGVIFAPVLNEIYYAEKGQGAWVELDGNLSGVRTSRLRVSDRSDMSSALLATNIHQDWPHQNIRNLGCNSLSLAYLAAGKIEACMLKDVPFCSVAAGVVLIQEAGGTVSKYSHDSNVCRELFASNTHFNALSS